MEQQKEDVFFSEDTKNILGLQLPTDPRWVDLASLSLEAILTDHAYCEQKAALSCISLIQKNPEKKELVQQLSPIVSEEWGHFRLVVNELHKRNLELGKQRKDAYVNRLLEFQIKGGNPDDRLLDQLLTMALIEARSCERFKRLSEGLTSTYQPEQKVKTRWKEWLAFEAGVMEEMELRGDRIH
jgi:tRNA-(ms[2]io[6]A)-hydroxylase